MDISEFNQKLSDSRREYELQEPLTDHYAHFRFIGDFEGNPTLWDARLYTLAYYVKEMAMSTQADTSTRQFIHVGDMGKSGRSVEVGLNLPTLDETAIVKTIIMLRQYKRLAYGRHEYGETINL